MKNWLLSLASLLLTGCLGYPGTVEPVNNFDVNRYLGKWYEVARLDHPFERGLSRVSADYSLLDDGVIKVVNRGYSASEDKWSQATGKASFVKSSDIGYLKVSFFGPFYGSYVIFDIDEANYQWAFVTGPDTSYLWLLARTPDVNDAIKERFKSRAVEAGYDTDELIWVEHEK